MHWHSWTICYERYFRNTVRQAQQSKISSLGPWQRLFLHPTALQFQPPGKFNQFEGFSPLQCSPAVPLYFHGSFDCFVSKETLISSTNLFIKGFFRNLSITNVSWNRRTKYNFAYPNTKHSIIGVFILKYFLWNLPVNLFILLIWAKLRDF